MVARDDLVFEALTRELPTSAARWDAFHLRAPRLGRRLLGTFGEGRTVQRGVFTRFRCNDSTIHGPRPRQLKC